MAGITKEWLASRWCFTEAVTANFEGKEFVGVLPAELSDGALDIAPPIVHDRQRQLLDLATEAGWSHLLHALDRTTFPSRRVSALGPGFASAGPRAADPTSRPPLTPAAG